MFTGIITDLGCVRSVTKTGDWRFEIDTSFDTSTIDMGASICCSGVCLTVIETGNDFFAVGVSQETISKTTLGLWKEGTPINLERSLKMGDEMGGHIVSGHVDGVGHLSANTAEGDSARLSFNATGNLIRFVAAKGSFGQRSLQARSRFDQRSFLFGQPLATHVITPGCQNLSFSEVLT